nr:Methylsterol monooxygenase [Rachicladosporium sp. CCFEE 5018]
MSVLTHGTGSFFGGNSTFADVMFPRTTNTYMHEYNQIAQTASYLNTPERMWAAWYAYIGNDVLATGIMSFMMHEIVYFGRCIPWLIVDRIKALRKYKIQTHKVPTAQEQWDCAKLVLLSHFTVELPQIWFFHPMAQYFGMAHTVPFPPLYKMIYQIAIFFVFEDAWHYWSHRALHWGPLYKNIHKIHHQYSAPFGLAAEYASPIEVMFLGIGTVSAPILWCAITQDLHVLTMYIWIVLRLFQAIDAHSGFDFPWSLHKFVPMWAGADWHDTHHEKFIGNYSSSFRWWDLMMDTQSGPEAAKKRRERKLAKAAKSA